MKFSIDNKTVIQVDAADLTDDGLCRIPEGVTTVGYMAFFGCLKLKEVIFPSSLVSIGASAFAQTGLKNLTLPGSLESIGYRSFAACYSLTTLDISGDGCLNESTFESCSSLKKVTIAEGVTLIPKRAFASCSRLENLTLPQSLESIDEEAFTGCHLKIVVIPDRVTLIGPRAFAFCDYLERVTIPDGVTHLSEETFIFCWSLTFIKLSQALIEIGLSAFMGCIQLKMIRIPESIMSINPNALEDRDALKAIVIDTQDEKERERILDLLSSSLQKKVLSSEWLQDVSVRVEKILQELAFLLDTKSCLYTFFSREAGKLKKLLSNNVLTTINGFLIDEHPQYLKAKKQIRCIPFPINKAELSEYEKQIEEIVSQFKQNYIHESEKTNKPSIFA